MSGSSCQLPGESKFRECRRPGALTFGSLHRDLEVQRPRLLSQVCLACGVGRVHDSYMPNRYAVPLQELENSVHVPVSEQISEQPAPPNPDLLAEADRDRLALLRVAGAV